MPSTSPLRAGRWPPKSNLHPQLSGAGLADPQDPSSYLLPPGSFPGFLSAPQLLAKPFPTHPHPTFTTTPTTTLPTAPRWCCSTTSKWLKQPRWRGLPGWVLWEIHLPPECTSSLVGSWAPRTGSPGAGSKSPNPDYRPPPPPRPSSRSKWGSLSCSPCLRHILVFGTRGVAPPSPDRGKATPAGAAPLAGRGRRRGRLAGKRSERPSPPRPLRGQEAAGGGGGARAGGLALLTPAAPSCAAAGAGGSGGGSAGDAEHS